MQNLMQSDIINGQTKVAFDILTYAMVNMVHPYIIIPDILY